MPLHITPPPSPPVASRGSVVRILLLMVLGGLTGYAVARFGAHLVTLPKVPKSWVLASLPLLSLAWLFTVAWHEAGHLLGGWAVGGRFLLYVVGPFKVQRTPTGTRFSWNFSFNLMGGLAACVPLEATDLPRRMAVLTIAGPLASVVLAVAGIWAGQLAGAAEWAVRSLPGFMLAFLLFATGGFSALIFLVTAFPGSAAGFKTDGARAIGLLRKDAAAAQESALLLLTARVLAGTRPRDLPEAALREATALDAATAHVAYGHLFAYQHAADRGEWDRAQTHLDAVLAREATMPTITRESVRAEYAWLLAAVAGEATQSRAWLQSAGKVAFEPATRLLAEAAVLRAEGRPTESASRAAEGLRALDERSLTPVRSAWTAERLQALCAA